MNTLDLVVLDLVVLDLVVLDLTAETTEDSWVAEAGAATLSLDNFVQKVAEVSLGCFKEETTEVSLGFFKEAAADFTACISIWYSKSFSILSLILI